MARILVIDDAAAVRYALREVLESAGHTVEEAEDGREGLALQYREPFPLIVTDVIMPEGDGIEVINGVRDSGAETKIVVISGGGRIGVQTVLDTARALGASHVLAKPVSEEELLAAVDACLDG